MIKGHFRKNQLWWAVAGIVAASLGFVALGLLERFL
jgi:hypothetical protein